MARRQEDGRILGLVRDAPRRRLGQAKEVIQQGRECDSKIHGFAREELCPVRKVHRRDLGG